MASTKKSKKTTGKKKKLTAPRSTTTGAVLSTKTTKSNKPKASKKVSSSKKKTKKTRLRAAESVTHLSHPAVAHATHQVVVPTHHRRLFIYSVMLIVGVAMMLGGGLYLLYRQTILSFKVAPVYQVTAAERTSMPQKIKINDVNIDLEVIPAYIENGIWQTSDTAATHLATSARPGEKSNMVIYGHNRPKLFKELPKVELDDLITVISSDGHEYHYKVISRNIVTPDQIDLVLPTEYEELTIYTCTGFLDSKRLVLKAVPVSVSYSL